VGEDQSPTKRVSVAEAAEILGLTVEAVRMRIKRGTLHSEKDAGRVYVLLGHQPTTEQPTELTDRTAELIATLREQLEAEREANRENRRIIAMLASRVPELEAPNQEPRESPQTATEEADRVEPQGAEQPPVLTDPGPPQLSPVLMALSWVGAGSVPILIRFLITVMEPTEPPYTLSPWVFSPLALFVLPFIFGLYRGVWQRRRQEYAQEHFLDPGQQVAYVGNVGRMEAITAFRTAGGAALAFLIELLLTWGPGALFSGWDLALFVFVGSFLFFVFAVLIGVATGGRQDLRDVSGSGTRGARLGSAPWWNPQLIFGLTGTIITAIATVYAASLAG
jgi:hypothetical protein